MTGETRSCLRCSARTSELKPYCIQHLREHAHAAEIERELERRAEEIREAASSHGTVAAIDVNGSVADDVLRVVISWSDKGGCTFDRIHRTTHIPERAVSRYVAALKRAGRVSVLKRPGKVPLVLYTGE